MRFSEPVMVVPGPSKVVYNCSNNSIILSGARVSAYLPLLLSNLSLGPLPSSSSLERNRCLTLSFPSWPRPLPAFISIPRPTLHPHRPPSLPHTGLPLMVERSVIIPSIPSRSRRSHIIRGCEGHSHAPGDRHGIVTKSYN